MHILIASPYPLDSPKGNSVSAKRIESLLRQAGHHATAIHDSKTPQADALIALHATKSWKTISYFKDHHPGSRLIIYLTGTDLYRDLPDENPDCLNALQMADQLVVSQETSLQSIPHQYLGKTHVVRTSIDRMEVANIAPVPQPSFALIAHLREVKNPFLMNKAMELIPDSDFHAYTLGSALEHCAAAEARAWQRTDSRFKWLDNLPHPETLAWISQVTATLNTSHMEGGANSVGESIMLGTPVLASRIEGNVGMLGEDYDGFFKPNCPHSLANLMQRVLNEPAFLQHLRLQVKERQPHFSPDSETQDWLHCLNPALGVSPRPSDILK